MIRILMIALRVLLVLFVVRLVLRGLAALRRPAPAAEPPPSRPMVRDRMCNTFLPRERALTAVVAGREEHFCSAACRDRALALAS